MESTDGACSAKWSRIVYAADVSHHGQKNGNHVCEKRLSSKKGHQKNNPPKTTHFSPFFAHFYHFLYFAALWSPRDHVVASPPRA